MKCAKCGKDISVLIEVKGADGKFHPINPAGLALEVECADCNLE